MYTYVIGLTETIITIWAKNYWPISGVHCHKQFIKAIFLTYMFSIEVYDYMCANLWICVFSK